MKKLMKKDLIITVTANEMKCMYGAEIITPKLKCSF